MVNGGGCAKNKVVLEAEDESCTTQEWDITNFRFIFFPIT